MRSSFYLKRLIIAISLNAFMMEVEREREEEKK